MSGFKSSTATSAMLVAKAENGNADEYLARLNQLHDAGNGSCPGDCCR